MEIHRNFSEGIQKGMFSSGFIFGIHPMLFAPSSIHITMAGISTYFNHPQMQGLSLGETHIDREWDSINSLCLLFVVVNFFEDTGKSRCLYHIKHPFIVGYTYIYTYIYIQMTPHCPLSQAP
jgi:hypothetical protein